MIRILEKEDIGKVARKYNIDLKYLLSLLDNQNEYMYISINEEIDGFMICSDDGNFINIKSIKGNSYDFLRFLVFNANKDVVINNEIEGLKEFDFQNDGKKYIRKYERIESNNIEIFDYYEQSDEFKKVLLGQINEPLWKGAKHLYKSIIENAEHGRLFIMYDKDRNHIITFATFHDFDEIESDTLKPWIGSLYTFRLYRGNRYSEKLIKYILNIAKQEGNENVYISSDNQGIYEKYGFDLYDMMTTVRGNETQVFIYDLKKLKKDKVL